MAGTRGGVRRVGAVEVVLLLLAGSLILFIRSHRARFEATVTPVRVSFAQCMTQLTNLPYGFSMTSAGSLCQTARGGEWFDATVRNTGRRLGFLKGCWVSGLDASGETLWRRYLSVGPLNFPTGPAMDAGNQIAWRWFLTDDQGQVQTPVPAASHIATCPVIDYHGNVPG